VKFRKWVRPDVGCSPQVLKMVPKLDILRFLFELLLPQVQLGYDVESVMCKTYRPNKTE